MREQISVSLTCAIFFCGCASLQVKTDLDLLGERLTPGATIVCAADFVALRWQQEGLVVSTEDSLSLGRDYLREVQDQLVSKGYTAASRGLIDVNWAFQEGAELTVVRDSEFRMTSYMGGLGGRVPEYDEVAPSSREIAPLKVEAVAAGQPGLQEFTRDAVRKAASLVKPTPGLKKQEEVDSWVSGVLRRQVVDPAAMSDYYGEADLVLLLWGWASITNPNQALARVNWGSVMAQAIAGLPVIRFRVPTNVVGLKGILMDASTGEILWFTSELAVSEQKALAGSLLFERSEEIVERLLVGFPEATAFGGDQVYSKEFSDF